MVFRPAGCRLNFARNSGLDWGAACLVGIERPCWFVQPAVLYQLKQAINTSFFAVSPITRCIDSGYNSECLALRFHRSLLPQSSETYHQWPFQAFSSKINFCTACFGPFLASPLVKQEQPGAAQLSHYGKLLWVPFYSFTCCKKHERWSLNLGQRLTWATDWTLHSRGYPRSWQRCSRIGCAREAGTSQSSSQACHHKGPGSNWQGASWL